MPVVGFISADGTSDQPEGLGHCSFEFALSLCEERSEAFPYPYPLLKGIVESIQNRGEYISATSILHCLRADFLKRTNDYYVTVESIYPAFRGTLFHGLLEANAPKNARIEEKVLRTYKGVEIGGTFDSLLVFEEEEADGRRKYVIQDWKTTAELPKYDSPYSSHLKQVNLYRWLLGLDPDEVTMEVHYFSMGGHKMCRLKDGTGIGRGGRAPSNQHWTDAQVEQYLDDRLMKLRASFVTRIPLPYDLVSEDDKWECRYCPVINICDKLTAQEREASWRKESGLPPAGTPVDAAPEWEVLLGDIRARVDATFAGATASSWTPPSSTAKPAAAKRKKSA